jgi:hypothetical protein
MGCTTPLGKSVVVVHKRATRASGSDPAYI